MVMNNLARIGARHLAVSMRQWRFARVWVGS